MSTPCVALRICDESIVSPGYFRGPLGHYSDESILIYLTMAGSVIPLRVLESDSIASVKLRIQTSKGFDARNQKLVLEGRELARNNCRVRDYGVADGNVLHLVVRLSDLQCITVRTTCGKEFEFHVERSKNVGYVKQQIAKKGKRFVDIANHVLICNGEKLDDQQRIYDISKNNDSVVHLLVRKSAEVRAESFAEDFELSIVADDLEERRNDGEEDVVEEQVWKEHDDSGIVDRKHLNGDAWLEPVVVNPKIKQSSVIRNLVNTTSAGMEQGNLPIRSSEGSGGAYFMPDSAGDKYIAVFKPIDEEPMAVNNPQGLPVSLDGEGLKRGTRVGEGAFREVAAYVLDYPRNGTRSSEGLGFAGVPPTVMVRCLHKDFNHPQGYESAAKNIKFGSLQMFMKNQGSCEDMGPRAFPVEEVHKITVLDMRLANADRHAGNILINKEGEDGRTVLIPIDHGYCLPENFEDCTFDWLYWPQARQPYAPDTVEYIKSLDAEKDIALLKFYGWDLSLECARTLRISTMLLKKGVERGLTPFTIGSIMCRETVKKESVIEEIVHEAQDSTLPGTSEAVFLESVSDIMDRRLDELTTV